VTPVYTHLHLVPGMSSRRHFIIIIQKVVNVIYLMGELNVIDNHMQSAQTINTSPLTKDK